jgi:WD40 repeat protein
MASAPVPPVLRSRLALADKRVRPVCKGAVAPGALPIHREGATFTMAQEIEWLDDRHFAVGRWDGSLSVFSWNASTSDGPLITAAASDPTAEGVQTIMQIGPNRMASSCGDASLAVWTALSGDWSSLRMTTFPYDPALGAANSALFIELAAGPQLIVGHAAGFVSRWHMDPGSGALTANGTLDLRNPTPVNPWDLHNIRAVQPYGVRFAVTGSEDGYICVVDLVEWSIRSQTVYNVSAERGINSVALSAAGDLLVANCAVGPHDSNLWYFTLDNNVLPQLSDHVNLRVDPNAAQVFNFCTIWAQSSQGPCFFSSTEEGALWMGAVSDGKLDIAGYDQVPSPLGSALGYRAGGRLALVTRPVRVRHRRIAPLARCVVRDRCHADHRAPGVQLLDRRVRQRG